MYGLVPVQPKACTFVMGFIFVLSNLLYALNELTL